MRPRAVAPLIATGLILLASRPARAHAFLRRYDLPLPLWHYLLGAGLAVALTFVLLGFFRTERSTQFAGGIDLAATALERWLTSRFFKQSLAIVSTVLFLVLLAAGFFGAQEDRSETSCRYLSGSSGGLVSLSSARWSVTPGQRSILGR